jgi:2-methylcitrate dehydratase PrpD
MAERPFSLSDVDDVEVAGLTHEARDVVLMYPEPVSAFQGKFSIHYTIATALIDGRIDVGSYQEDRIRRPEYAEARRKVHVTVAPRWQTPPGGAPTTVTVRLRGGEVLQRTVDAHFAHGTRHDPLTDQEQKDKFSNNARFVLEAERTKAALDAWWRIDTAPDIGHALSLIGCAE